MIWYAAAGIAFGIIGGMGMGGGIILIPVLTFLLGEAQHSAQAMNLIAFLPMSAFALFTHIKNKRVDIRVSLIMAVCGFIGAAGGAFAATALDAVFLKKLFGGFLILLSFLRIFKQYKRAKKR